VDAGIPFGLSHLLGLPTHRVLYGGHRVLIELRPVRHGHDLSCQDRPEVLGLNLGSKLLYQDVELRGCLDQCHPEAAGLRACDT
jgi:hypothetical protein